MSQKHSSARGKLRQTKNQVQNLLYLIIRENGNSVPFKGEALSSMKRLREGLFLELSQTVDDLNPACITLRTMGIA